ncbi:MAG TPA: retroviral-like aspartic protease family protein [Thermoanaerobaculia bacterium]
MTRKLVVVLALLTAARCALYSDVSIEPLTIIPTKIERGADLRDMVKRADYLRAVELAPNVDARVRKSAEELVALGQAELAANRITEARHHLRTAIDLSPFHTTYADAAWGLSQVEFMDNNYETSLEWAQVAMQHGLTVLQWHLDYLKAMSHVQAYRAASAVRSEEMRMKIGRPDVPRIEVRLNKAESTTTAVIDSGAVLSIMSQRLASQVPVKRLPTSRGTFYGLLGEPISVDFAMVDLLEIGGIVLADVPVAIMPDDKMRFLVSGKKEFRIDFLLGANLLKEFRLDFNFDNNHVKFTRLTSTDKRPVANQNLFFEQFRPHVRGTVNKRGWFLFVLDTGSEVTFLNEHQLPSLPINMFAPRVHNATLQGLGGARKHGSKIEEVEIGVDRWAGAFRTLPMYSGGEQERSVGIIGENFLKNFHAVIDFGRMRVDLQRR